jgi:transposase
MAHAVHVAARFPALTMRSKQQTRRWLDAGVFAEIVHDLRPLLRLGEGRAGQPSAAMLDSRTLQSSPESGGRASHDGHKRKKGSKVHAAVDTLGHLLAVLRNHGLRWNTVSPVAFLTSRIRANSNLRVRMGLGGGM